MTDYQPLTCVRCWHSPASRLLVIDYRSEHMQRLLCVPCAALDEADAPGLPGFKGVTVLAVTPVSAGSAVQAAAEVLFRDYESEFSAGHLTWRDFADLARQVLTAAAASDETEKSDG